MQRKRTTQSGSGSPPTSSSGRTKAGDGGARVTQPIAFAFVPMPLALLDDERLAPIDKIVWLHLYRYDQMSGGKGAFPSHRTLGRDVDRGITQVKESLKRLQDAGWIRIVVEKVPGKRQTSNIYQVHKPF